jgi:hypothetical protein
MKSVMEEAIARGRTTAGPDLKNDVDIVMIKPLPAPRPKGKAKK